VIGNAGERDGLADVRFKDEAAMRTSRWWRVGTPPACWDSAVLISMGVGIFNAA
jgi:hypothetical protein